MKKINEIFYSLQGEGANAGKPAVFIRFSGCNLKCPFCDTEHENGRMMTDDEIVSEVAKYPCNLIVITGGEPTLFVDDSLLDKLHSIGKVVAMESNGTRPLSGLDIDFLTISPKFEFTSGAELKQKECNELKVVFNGENDMSLYNGISAQFYYIQPCDTQNAVKNAEIVQKAVQFCLDNPKWNLSLQTQKILNVR